MSNNKRMLVLLVVLSVLLLVSGSYKPMRAFAVCEKPDGRVKIRIANGLEGNYLFYPLVDGQEKYLWHDGVETKIAVDASPGSFILLNQDVVDPEILMWDGHPIHFFGRIPDDIPLCIVLFP